MSVILLHTLGMSLIHDNKIDLPKIKKWMSSPNCLVELVTIREGVSMWVDEEGLLKRLPVNRYATVLMEYVTHQAGGYLIAPIVGNVVLTGEITETKILPIRPPEIKWITAIFG